MEKGHSGRSIAIGSSSNSAITSISAAYTVLPTDRIINVTGTGTFTITLCHPSKFPANEYLLIHKAESSGEVTVSTPAGGIFATIDGKSFVVDGLTAAEDHKLLLNVHGVQWIEVKELTT